MRWPKPSARLMKTLNKERPEVVWRRSVHPVEFGVSAVHWDAKHTAARRFKVHVLLDEQRGLYELTDCFDCSAAALATTIESGALVWTMSLRSENRYRRCAPIFPDKGENVFTVPHELLLELPVY